jgi:soluble lytic murein transglycosylase
MQSVHNTEWIYRFICKLFFIFIVSLHTGLYSESVYSKSIDTLRSQYVKANQALKLRQISKFHKIRKTLLDYPLYPYLVYSNITRRISRTKEIEVAQFLKTYPNTHLSETLRKKWLYALARREKWKTFIKFYTDVGSASLSCLHVKAKIKLNYDSDLAHEIEKVWLHGKSQPKECNYVFKFAEKKGYLSKELRLQRIFLAISNGKLNLSDYLAKKLPKAERKWIVFWIKAHRSPKKYLKHKKLKIDNRLSRHVIAHSLIRLARKDALSATRFWKKYKSYKFGPEWSHQIERDIAITSVRTRQKAAKAIMDMVASDARNGEYYLWLCKQAIQDQDWYTLHNNIDRLQKNERNRNKWKYWGAKASFAVGQKEKASAIFAELSNTRGYYGFLAAKLLGVEYELNHRPLEFSRQYLEAIKTIPIFARIQELQNLGDHLNAKREFRDLTNSADNELVNAAALLLYNQGEYSFAIRALGATKYFDDLMMRFPLPFKNLFKKHANKSGLDIAWLYAVARRESAFDATVVSPAGATGLMQLMPRTAKLMAKQLRLKRPYRRHLKKPNLNITLGVTYLKRMLKRYQGNLVLALAAYNAGPHRVHKWLPSQKTPADIWVESIPINETRLYVKFVMEYITIYEWRLKKQFSSIGKRMNAIKSDY